METFITIIKYVVMCGSILFYAVLPFGIWGFKKIKKLITTPADKMPDKVLEIWRNLFSYIPGAEKMFHDGEAKLEYVLGRIETDCLSAGIKFVRDEWVEIVNMIVGMTNNVNVAKLVRPVTTAK